MGRGVQKLPTRQQEVRRSAHEVKGILQRVYTGDDGTDHERVHQGRGRCLRGTFLHEQSLRTEQTGQPTLHEDPMSNSSSASMLIDVNHLRVVTEENIHLVRWKNDPEHLESTVRQAAAVLDYHV